jgi:hypothetical protein
VQSTDRWFGMFSTSEKNLPENGLMHITRTGAVHIHTRETSLDWPSLWSIRKMADYFEGALLDKHFIRGRLKKTRRFLWTSRLAEGEPRLHSSFHHSCTGYPQTYPVTCACHTTKILKTAPQGCFSTNTTGSGLNPLRTPDIVLWSAELLLTKGESPSARHTEAFRVLTKP